MKKNGLSLILIILLLVTLFGVFSSYMLSREREIISNNQGDPDLLGSYYYVNQEIRKAEDWQQIVVESEFQLGESYQQNEENFWDYDTYPVIDGSTVALAMAHEFAWQHLGMDETESRNFINFSTTHYAYLGMIHYSPGPGGWYMGTMMDPDKSADLLIATYPSLEELQEAEASGVELLIEPICYDAFVFITHIDNPVDSLTIEQIQKIYTQEITNWQQVGGNDEQIVAYQREANSGSQTGMETLVMQGIAMADPKTVEVIYGMGGLIEAVAEYENETQSIGYTYRYYIDNLYKNPEIKILEVEGIAPSAENMQNNSYPFTTNYYGIIRNADKENTGGKFLEWMLSEEGQKCIEQAGYVPIR